MYSTRDQPQLSRLLRAAIEQVGVGRDLRREARRARIMGQRTYEGVAKFEHARVCVVRLFGLRDRVDGPRTAFHLLLEERDHAVVPGNPHKVNVLLPGKPVTAVGQAWHFQKSVRYPIGKAPKFSMLICQNVVRVERYRR